MTPSHAVRALAAIAVLFGAACARGLPIEGAPCPCPGGYACGSDQRCVASSQVRLPEAGVRDTPPAETSPGDDGGAGLATDVGARPISLGDHIVVGFSSSGRYLVTLGSPTTSPTGPQGRVEIHDVEAGGDPVKFDVTSDLASVWISRAVDAVVVPGWGWTPELGLEQVAERPVLSSPDGRYLVTAGRFFETADTGPPKYLQLELTSKLTGAAAFLREVALRPTHKTSLEFSPDASFVYMLEIVDPPFDQGLVPRLTRVPTDGTLPVKTFEANAILAADGGPLAPSLFAYGADGTVVFNATGGVWAWHPTADAPVMLVRDGPGPARFVGAGGDWAYVELGALQSVSHARIDSVVERVSLSTGKPEAFLTGALGTGVQWLTPAPDGKLGILARSSGRSLLDLTKRSMVAALPSCVSCAPDRFSLRFSPDSSWLFGGGGRLATGGDELWLGDVVAWRMPAGELVPVATQAVSHDPLLVGEGHLAFVAMKSDSLLLAPRTSPVGSGDLVVASLADRTSTVVAPDADEYIAARGQRVAFSRHHADQTGVYLLDLP